MTVPLIAVAMVVTALIGGLAIMLWATYPETN